MMNLLLKTKKKNRLSSVCWENIRVSPNPPNYRFKLNSGICSCKQNLADSGLILLISMKIPIFEQNLILKKAKTSTKGLITYRFYCPLDILLQVNFESLFETSSSDGVDLQAAKESPRF